MKILVTGGSGFVGKAAVAELLSRGNEVVATTRNTAVSGLTSHPRLSWLEWDGTQKTLPAADWATFDSILHLAVPASPFTFPDKNEALFQTQVAASFQLLEIARKHSIKSLLFGSTGDVFSSESEPPTENHKHYAPSSFYGTTKACMELMAQAYSPVLCTMSLRFFHPYGPGGDKFLINRLLLQVGEGKEIKIEGKDGILLNPLWVEDLAVGIALAIENPQPGIFHFSGPDLLTLRELLVLIGELIDKEPRLINVQGPCSHHHAGRFEKTATLLGFSPKVGIKEGLERLLESAPYAKLKSSYEIS